MADHVDKRMISDAKLDQLIGEFQREREFSTEELKSTQLMVRQFTSTVEKTVNNLADKIEKQSDQLHEQAKQVHELFIKTEGNRQNQGIIQNNILKTQEEMAMKLATIENRTHKVEMRQSEIRSEATKISPIEDRVKSLESAGIGSIPKLDERVSSVESFIDEHRGEKLFKDKWWHWWSRNWWKVIGLLVPASYVIVSVAEKVKSDFGG